MQQVIPTIIQSIMEITTVSFENFSENDKYFIEETVKLTDLSPANKKKVSTIIGNPFNKKIISLGNNRMFETLPDQDCEDSEGKTIPYIMHAEEVAILNYLKSTSIRKKHSMEDLTIYCSYAPCHNCAKLIAHIGITRVIYLEKHLHKFHVGRYSPAVFLHQMKINVIEVTELL